METCEDIGIEVVEEIPGINRCHSHARKTLYHAGHVSNNNDNHACDIWDEGLIFFVMNLLFLFVM